MCPHRAVRESSRPCFIHGLHVCIPAHLLNSPNPRAPGDYRSTPRFNEFGFDKQLDPNS